MLYALIARLLLPTAWWGRMKVEGIDLVPERGTLLVVSNHDSQWDPVLLGVALRKRRPLRFLARANLWRIFGLKPILNALRQIPIERGAGDMEALERAVEALRLGEAVCVFPEGKLSRGERLPARSGIGRLASACPGVAVVLCAIEGTTDYVRFPRRPRVSISSSSRRAGSRGRTRTHRRWPPASSTRSGSGCRRWPRGAAEHSGSPRTGQPVRCAQQ